MKKEELIKEFNIAYKAGQIYSLYLTPTKEPDKDVELLFDYLNISDEMNIPGSSKAMIGWEDQDLAHGYIESFFRIANLCVNKMETGFEDYYVYSIMYNYRQYIELSLKELILSLQLSFGKNLIYKNSHCLDKLTEQLNELLEEVTLESFLPVNIKKSILEFQELDPRNDKFRFNYKTDGQPSFDYTPKFFDLKKIAIGMNILHEWFDTILLLFSDGSLANPYVTIPTYKHFSRISSNLLLNKNQNQINNILKNIKFDFIQEDKSQSSSSNEKNEIYFNMSTFEDDNISEIIICTNHNLSYKIHYENQNGKKKIISFASNDPIVFN